MDPLSIATSVAGLLGAGGKLAAILTLISRLSDAPPLCKAVLTEVCDTAAALRQVQNFLNDQLHVPSERREHVLLEHVAIALTGCVITKDELESLLDGMGLVYAVGDITGIFDRVKWIRKEQDIQRLVQQLQNHKGSLNLILTIFQCSSVSQIQDSVSRLSALIKEAVTNSSVLSTRLSRLEGSSTLGYPTSETSIINNSEPTNANDPEEPDGDDASTRTITQVTADQSQNESQLVPASFAFEPELQVSRVYRKLELLGSDGHSETSITTSARQSTAASIFSKLSLADISNLSQYSLPILIQEIGNNRWYIQVGRMPESGEFVATTSRINFNVTFLTGRRKSYMLEPSDTAHRLKEMIQNDEGLPPDWMVLVYTLPGGTIRKLQDEKSFSEQGITSTHPTARVYILPHHRGTGSHYPDTISEKERGEFRRVIHRGDDGKVVFERFYGG